MGSIQIKSESSAEQQLNWLEVVRRQVGLLHYGMAQIVVHDSQVTQIEKTGRVRLESRQLKKFNTDRNAGGANKKQNERLTGRIGNRVEKMKTKLNRLILATFAGLQFAFPKSFQVHHFSSRYHPR